MFRPLGQGPLPPLLIIAVEHEYFMGRDGHLHPARISRPSCSRRSVDRRSLKRHRPLGNSSLSSR
jgi:hypothetical protein